MEYKILHLDNRKRHYSEILQYLLLICFMVSGSLAQDFFTGNNIIGSAHSHFGCDCMEYWTCILGGGTPHSYCGLTDHDVCCFVPENAAPIGILPTPSASQCGRKGFDSGRDGKAEMGEWPWHAAILEKPQDLYVCGSTLIDEYWVLTAAHCVDDYVPYVSGIREILKVRVGEYDVSTTSEPLKHQEFNVSDIKIHPQFDNATLVNDIALLRLETPVKRKQNIDVVCVPGQTDVDLVPKKICYVTGWGRRNEESEHSVILKEISVPLWDQQKCDASLKAQFGPGYNLPLTALCAGAEGRDACDNLQNHYCSTDNFQLCRIGISFNNIGFKDKIIENSFGIGCGRKGVPGVYTRVQSYQTWLEDTILSQL